MSADAVVQRRPPKALTLYWCPACGWDSQAWGPDFWKRHIEAEEDRELGLDCLDGGRMATKLRYWLRDAS